MARHEGAGRDDSRADLCDLAHAWWDTRLDPDWRPRSRDETRRSSTASGSSARSGTSPNSYV